MTVPILSQDTGQGEGSENAFRFLKHPEYLKVGAKLLFRGGCAGHTAMSLMCKPLQQERPRPTWASELQAGTALLLSLQYKDDFKPTSPRWRLCVLVG